MSMRDQIAKAIVSRIKAWHSSPHDFDKFDLEKIGSGQGAASYGPGIYAAESPKVSGQGGEYWKEFMRHPDVPNTDVARILEQNNFDRGAAINAVKKQISDLQQHLKSGTMPLNVANQHTDPGIIHGTINGMLREREEQLALLAGNRQVGPRTYELNIKADPQSFLQWDQPLAAQSQIWDRIDPRVKGAIDEAMDARGANTMSDVPEAYTGKELWQALKHHDVHESLPPVIGKSDWYKGDTDEARHSMEYLKSLDIPGIRYLDAQSRGMIDPAKAQNDLDAIIKRIADLRADGNNLRASELDLTKSRMEHAMSQPRTYNYVINNPDIIDITKKYGIPAAIAGPAIGAVAAQDEYR
jgi:hypothetical protein